jgi:hypothetical protein
MQAVNAQIALVAARLEESSGESVWGFACECGDPTCTARVELELVAYQAMCSSGRSVLADGHKVRLGVPRRRAQERRGDAVAVQAQTKQLTKRHRRGRR